VVLRGGSEAINSNLAIAAVLQGVLRTMNIPEAALSLIPFTEREGVLEMAQTGRVYRSDHTAWWRKPDPLCG